MKTAPKSKRSLLPPKILRQGKTPILDEQAILMTLQAPALLETLEYTRYASANSVAACFDRKVERDFFISVLNLAFNINEHARRFQLMSAVVEGIQATPPIPIEKLVTARDTLGAELEIWKKQLVDRMTLIVQMPNDDDPIN